MLGRLRGIFVGFVVLFLLLPVLAIAVSSVSISPLFVFPPSGFTWQWYGSIPSSYLDALRISTAVAGGSTALALLVGVPAAIALARGRFPFGSTLSALLLSPLMIPSLVIGVALFQFSPVIWTNFGVSLTGTVFGLIVAHGTFTIPLVIRAVIAGQTQFDNSVEEAATSLGASPFRTFLTITLPVLSPSIVSGGIFAFLMSFDDVPVSLFVGGGTTTTLPVAIFNAIQFNLSPDLMALCTLVSMGVLVLLLICSRLLGSDLFFGSSHG